MITVVTLLRNQLDDAFDLVRKAMADVNNSMIHWEPAPGCWGLRLRNGQWFPDFDKPRPPAPKTIAWLAAHLAGCKDMYYEYAFGPAKKKWKDLEGPGDAINLRLYLENTQNALVKKLAELNDVDLDRPALTNWGEEKPIWWIYWIMIYHDAEHGGQIMQVKNEYRNRIASESSAVS